MCKLAVAETYASVYPPSLQVPIPIRYKYVLHPGHGSVHYFLQSTVPFNTYVNLIFTAQSSSKG